MTRREEDDVIKMMRTLLRYIDEPIRHNSYRFNGQLQPRVKRQLTKIQNKIIKIHHSEILNQRSN